MATRTYVIDGQRFEVELEPGSYRTGSAIVNGRRYTFEQPAAAAHPVAIAAVPAPPAARAHAAARPSAGELRAPMAGRVIQLRVAGGEHVEAGAPLLVLDAMKMENTLFAPSSGSVEEIAVSVGDTVLQGALLVRLRSEAAE